MGKKSKNEPAGLFAYACSHLSFKISCLPCIRNHLSYPSSLANATWNSEFLKHKIQKKRNGGERERSENLHHPHIGQNIMPHGTLTNHRKIVYLPSVVEMSHECFSKAIFFSRSLPNRWHGSDSGNRCFTFRLICVMSGTQHNTTKLYAAEARVISLRLDGIMLTNECQTETEKRARWR